MEKILIIAAHPDDEVLGCGGTIARLKREGKTIGLLVLTDGEGSRDSDNKIKRQEELARSSEMLGIDKFWLYDFPDNELDTVSKLTLVKKLEEILEYFGPDTVFTHSPSDLNQDHRVIAEITSIACRSVPGAKVQRVYYYEVPSSTEWSIENKFHPQMYIELSPQDWDKKSQALLVYKDELRPEPHPRSLEMIKAKMMVRGAECGTFYAEAFQIRYLKL